MSRNLLIFGQGSMACHPFVRDELAAIIDGDRTTFSRLIWQHIHYFLQNFATAMCSGWTGGKFARVPASPLKKYYQRLTRLSHGYAWLADLCLIMLGGALKRRERISARLADGMSYLYMAMAVLRVAQEHHESQDHHAHAEWALQYCLHHAQKAMMDLCQNFPVPFLGSMVSWLLFPLGATMRYPSDTLSHTLAQVMQHPNDVRRMVVSALYLSGDTTQPIDRVEHAFGLINRHKDIYQTVLAKYHGKRDDLRDALLAKVKEGKIKSEDVETLLEIDKACWDAILVDEFDFKEIAAKQYRSITE